MGRPQATYEKLAELLERLFCITNCSERRLSPGKMVKEQDEEEEFKRLPDFVLNVEKVLENDDGTA